MRKVYGLLKNPNEQYLFIKYFLVPRDGTDHFKNHWDSFITCSS